MLNKQATKKQQIRLKKTKKSFKRIKRGKNFFMSEIRENPLLHLSSV